MVVPWALAETVTPPSFSPVAEAIVPLSAKSAACAEVARPPARLAARFAAANAATPNMNLKAFMAFSPSDCLTRGDRGYRLEKGDDGVDLGALQIMLEGRHAWRAFADHAPDHLVAAA